VELRQERFIDAWKLWLTAPLTGAGAGSFAYHYPANQLRVYPHNMLLELLSELGVIGLALWTVMLVIAFGGFIKRGGWRRSLSVVVLGFFTFAIANAMISGDIVSNRHVFTSLGLLVATSALWIKEQ
jgi:O-antigen ligase